MSRRFVAVALAAAAGLATACHRSASSQAAVAQPLVAAPRPKTPLLFTHPLFAGMRAEPVTADCSRTALVRLAERVRTVEGDVGDVGLLETRNELLPHAASCVGHDTPLDVPWEMLHSAILSLEICTDARQKPGERATRCRRALEIAGRAEQGG